MRKQRTLRTLTFRRFAEHYQKYNAPECREFMELKRKAPKAKFRTTFMPGSESQSEHKGKAHVSGRLEREEILRRSKKTET